MQRAAVLVRAALLVVVVGALCLASGAASAHRRAEHAADGTGSYTASASHGEHASGVPHSKLRSQRHADPTCPRPLAGAARVEGRERPSLATVASGPPASPSLALSARHPARLQTRAPPG